MPERDTFSWWNPGDWFGGHDETSIWKSEEENRKVLRSQKQDVPTPAQDSLKGFKDMFEDLYSSAQDRNDELRSEAERARSQRDDLAGGVWDRWEDSREGILGRWDKTSTEELNRMRGVAESHQGLINEVANAPSSVEQQAKQAYDAQLRESGALASVLGRGVSGGDQALRDRTQNQGANILRQTAVGRSNEYIQRAGLKSNLLGQQSALSGNILNFAMGDANLRRGVAKDDLGIGMGVSGLRDKGLSDLFALRGQERADQSLYSNNMLNFGRLNMAGMESDFNRYNQNRMFEQAQLNKIDKQRSGLFEGGLTLAGDVAGSFFGAPGAASAAKGAAQPAASKESFGYWDQMAARSVAGF